MAAATTPGAERAGASLGKALRLARLLVRPSLTRTYAMVRRVEHIDLVQLREDGIKGILLDADGTLAPHHIRTFTPEVVSFVRRCRQEGFQVAIYTNADDADHFSEVLGAPIATGLPAKPSREGFLGAMAVLGLTDPTEVVMVGDSYITDGGAVEVGMHFIHCAPLRGTEGLGHRLIRGVALQAANTWRLLQR